MEVVLYQQLSGMAEKIKEILQYNRHPGPDSNPGTPK
jgi:hypothetical protein